jgi:3-dehydroquinate synthase
MHRIRVRLPAPAPRDYSIQIRPGMLDDLPGIIRRRARGVRVYVITDTTVGRLYGRQLMHALAADVPGSLLLDVPPGEASKSVRVWGALTSAILRGGMGRDGLIVALGGGVVGDLAGFVAATVMRGVRYLQVPTTLLAQVDSSVGGKTGIDHAIGKNLIGSFHQPVEVVIDPRVLRTLTVREFRAGLAEVVKIGVALDRTLLSSLERNAAAVLRRDTTALSTIIAHAVGLKAAVVGADEREADLRKSLNLGHTIGHAVEAASGYRLLHGECVAIGMAAEARIAVRLGLLKPGEELHILTLLRRFGLPTTMPKLRSVSVFAKALTTDKKTRLGVPEFALPAGVGCCTIGISVPSDVITAVTGVRL